MNDDVAMRRPPVIDRVREYWDRRPCNIRHSTAPVMSLQYSQEVTARKYTIEPHIPEFAQFRRWTGKHVLEIGCGIGTDTLEFARSGANVTAVDLSRPSLDICQHRLNAEGLTATLVLGDIEHLPPLGRPQFDLIYAFGVLHHTPNPALALRNFLHYMTPTTELRIMMYAKYSWKNLMIHLNKDQHEAQAACPIANTYSADALTKLLYPLRIQSIEKAHIFPWKIDKYVKYEYEKVWYFRWMPAAMFAFLERHLGWHQLVVATR